MKFLLISFAILATFAAQAQLRAPDRQLQSVADPANVLMDRGAKLEILPRIRAIPTVTGTGQVAAHQLLQTYPANSIGPQQLGVIFNHSMQQQGYISGEIAFQLKPSAMSRSFDPALYPGLQKVTNPEVYVVNARTPFEFLKLMKRLQARADIEWVVPTVTYAPGPSDPRTR